jgi:nucleoside-diphosphate-sugar epimerase
VVGSYGHVDDLCEAMVAMVGNPAAIGQVFNITADSITVNRYIEVLADVVGETPDVVLLPDSMLGDLPGSVFSHLFGVRHHAMMSIEKAQRMIGFRNRFDLSTGHVDTYEWFRRKGYADVEGPMVDPLWRASWDFDREAEVAERVRRE